MSRLFPTRPLRSLPWFVAALTVAAACSDKPANVNTVDTGPLVADSAGLRIVSDTAPSWGTAQLWTVGN